MNSIIKEANKRIKHLSIEIKENLKDGIHTTKASDMFKEHADIQNILETIDNLKTIKFKKIGHRKQ
jgi:hypothetical protein